MTMSSGIHSQFPNRILLRPFQGSYRERFGNSRELKRLLLNAANLAQEGVYEVGIREQAEGVVEVFTDGELCINETFDGHSHVLGVYSKAAFAASDADLITSTFRGKGYILSTAGIARYQVTSREQVRKFHEAAPYVEGVPFHLTKIGFLMAEIGQHDIQGYQDAMLRQFGVRFVFEPFESQLGDRTQMPEQRRGLFEGLDIENLHRRPEVIDVLAKPYREVVENTSLAWKRGITEADKHSLEETVAEYNPGIQTDSLIAYYLSGFEVDFPAACRDFGDKVDAGKAEAEDYAAIILRSLCRNRLAEQSALYRVPADVEVAQLVRGEITGLSPCFPLGLDFGFSFEGTPPLDTRLTRTVDVFMKRIFQRTFGYDFAFLRF